MWLQNVESCSHNSKFDCKMLKVAVQIRQKSQWRDYIILKIAVIFQNLPSYFHHFSNFAVIFRKLQSCDCRFWKIAVTFLKLQSRDCRFRNLTAKCWKLQSDFELWLQLSTFCGHISNYAVIFWKLQSRDCRFRIMTATFNILRSHFELWLQNVEMDFWNWCRGIEEHILQYNNWNNFKLV